MPHATNLCHPSSMTWIAEEFNATSVVAGAPHYLALWRRRQRKVRFSSQQVRDAWMDAVDAADNNLMTAADGRQRKQYENQLFEEQAGQMLGRRANFKTYPWDTLSATNPSVTGGIGVRWGGEKTPDFVLVTDFTHEEEEEGLADGFVTEKSRVGDVFHSDGNSKTFRNRVKDKMKSYYWPGYGRVVLVSNIFKERDALEGDMRRWADQARTVKNSNFNRFEMYFCDIANNILLRVDTKTGELHTMPGANQAGATLFATKMKQSALLPGILALAGTASVATFWCNRRRTSNTDKQEALLEGQA